MTKNIETGMTLSGSAKFGKVLLEEAAKHNQEKLSKVVVSTIGELLIQIEEQEKALKVMKAMHEALATGQFDLNRHGQITYKDSELNEGVRWHSRCAQCGYDKIVIAEHRGGY